MSNLIELTDLNGKKHLFKKDSIFEVEELGNGCSKIYMEYGATEVCEPYKYVLEELTKE